MIKCEDYIINAANLGNCNPLPDLKNVSYIHAGYEMTDKITREERVGIGQGMISTMLPYKLQDGYDRNRKPRAFKAVSVENKYLKAIFLPELGGRLWSLYDKENDRELLYKNSVFQPANLALRNAWFSGGIEFNVGIKGHNPLTCSPLFAEILTYPDNMQVLRMYEFERIREITYSISVCLPEDSKLLYIKERIENTSDENKFAYWWSNIAVPETDKTRIVVPADETFLSSYNEGQYLVDKIAVPMHNGNDLTYPKNSVRSQDFFYKIPADNSKWIAAVQEDGYGLLQLSNKKMIGRKLFVWGHGAGGRNWGEWLSEKGSSYVEIQAGLAHTQLEHIPMKAHETWEWVEAYGAINCDKNAVHSDDWKAAQAAVTNRFECLLDADALDKSLSEIFPKEKNFIDIEKVNYGSGWGALENILRKKASKEEISDFCEFPNDSINEEQMQWINLIEKGHFLPVSIDDDPVSYVSGEVWREMLENAAHKSGEQQWYALLQLGVHYYISGEIDNARIAWEESARIKESAWSYRNLSLIYKNEYKNIDKAVEYIKKAVSLKNDCRGIIVDCAKIFTDNKLDRLWLETYEELPEKMKSDGRIRLYKAIAHINLFEVDKACDIVNENFEMYDIQEGEVSVSHIWQKLYKMKIQAELGITDDKELAVKVNQHYPLPKHLDFRMHE